MMYMVVSSLIYDVETDAREDHIIVFKLAI